MISLYCCSDRGEALGKQIAAHFMTPPLNEKNDQVRSYTLEEAKAKGGIKACAAADFKDSAAMIFIGATGIAVRAIAPLIESKFTDPAVLVIDDQGRFVISLLSGHVGGGNALAVELAKAIGATPVVTTASDGMGLASIDLVLKAAGVPVHLYRDLALNLASRMLKGEIVALYTEEPERLSACGLEGIKLLDRWEDLLAAKATIKLYIGNRLSRIAEVEKMNELGKIAELGKWENAYVAIPKNLVLGTGSRKGLDNELYKNAFEAYMASLDLSPKGVRVLASVDIKAEESCMLALAETYEMETRFYTKEALSTVQEAFPRSEQVYKVLGLNGVAGPAAYLLSQGHLIGDVWKGSGCTFAIGREQTW